MSANVIDSLLFELGLDATNFKKGAKETDRTLDNTARRVKANSRDMSASISSMARNFAVAFLGWKGVQGLIDLNRTASQMGYLAANTGQTTEKVNALGEAMRLSGGEASDAAAMLQKIAAEQSNIKLTGNTAWAVPLQRLKLDIVDTGLEAKDSYEVILRMADALGKLKRPDAFNLGTSQLGFSENQLNFLLQGRKAIESQTAAQLKQYKLTKAEADAARSTQKSIDALKIKAEHVFRDLLTQLRPFIDEFTAWVGGISVTPAAMQTAVDALKALGKGIQFFVDVVKLAVKGWSDIMGSEVGKFMSKMIGTGVEKFHEYVNQESSAEGSAEGPRESFSWRDLSPVMLALDSWIAWRESQQPSLEHPRLTNAGAWALSQGSMSKEFAAARAADAAARDMAGRSGSGSVVNNTRIDSVTINARENAGKTLVSVAQQPEVRNKQRVTQGTSGLRP